MFESSSSPNSAIFPIPDLVPLLRCYNIPAPVIHPPGSDPNLFLNPNSHGDEALEPPSPMDIDPCTASRSLIVVQTADLTASELAGGALIKPTTIVFTTSSDSPANSEVSVPQIVNDVVVTNIVTDQESQPLVMNATLDQEMQSVDSFVCKIPNIQFDNLNLVAKLVTNQVAETSCGDRVPNPTVVNTTMVQKGHQMMWCEVCKVGCNGDKCFEKHMSGKQHLKNLKVSEKNVGPVSTAGDSEENKLWCQVCKISCPRNNLNGHVTGKKHIKNLEKSKKMTDLPLPVAEKVNLTKGEVVNPNETYYSTRCELCGICCTSRDGLNVHFLGKKHQKNLRKEEGKMVISDRNKRNANCLLASDADDVDTKRQKVMMEEEEEEGCGVLVTCKVCNMVCTSLMVFKSHLASFEHSTMALKQVKGV